MTISQAAAQLRERRLSAADLLESHLARIAEQNPKLNAFLAVTADSARAQAAQCDRELAGGGSRGPLHGIPIALKDIFDVAGVATTAGSPLFGKQPAKQDCTVTARLKAAGAVILGKTNLHELCYGITSNNPHFGPARNPVDPQRTPGGSSGGSAAAVAADLAIAAMGSDTGGSIRIPASFCGCVGIKPTFGLVSRYGVAPLGFSLDHMGPLTRSVEDAALVLQAIAGHDPQDPTTVNRPVPEYLPADPSVGRIRIGWPENFYFERVDPEVAAALEHQRDRAAKLGARIVPIRVPDVEAANTVARVLLLSEASALYASRMSDRSLFGADVLALLDQGRLLPATDYINAQRVRRQQQAEWARLWDSVDCLIAPATPTTAPLIGQNTISIQGVEEDVRLASTRLVRAINGLGLPALSLPAGHSRGGLPIGMQIIGKPFSEAALFRIGAALERPD